jgi:hypothetical protein
MNGMFCECKKLKEIKVNKNLYQKIKDIIFNNNIKFIIDIKEEKDKKISTIKAFIPRLIECLQKIRLNKKKDIMKKIKENKGQIISSNILKIDLNKMILKKKKEIDIFIKKDNFYSEWGLYLK